MLSDPRRALWITIAVGALAALWIGVYVLFNEELLDAIGDGAHASAFLSAVIAVSCVFIALMFRRFARVREGLRLQQALARWRVERGEWKTFARAVAPGVAADMRMTLGLIVFFAVVIPGAMALGGMDPAILFWIALGIIGVGFLGYGLGRRQTAAVYRYRGGEVALGRDGIEVNGTYHVWGVVGSHLVSAEIEEHVVPARLTLVYAYWMRAGEQFVTVYAPVPAAELKRVAAALGKLGTPPDETPVVVREHAA